MIIKHECNEITSNQTLETLVATISEVNTMICDLINVTKSLTRFSEGKYDDDDLLDILEESSLGFSPNFTKFASDSSSKISSLNRCTRLLIDQNVYNENGEVSEKVLGAISLFNRDIEQIVRSGAAPSISEVEKIKSFVSKMIGNLAYFLKFEFKIDDTLKSAEDGEMIVDAAVSEYCDSADEPVVDWCNSILDVLKVYKPKLEVFDEHPELEEPFATIMGPFLTDGISEDLTIDIVNDVISGKISPQDIWGILNPNMVEEV